MSLYNMPTNTEILDFIKDFSSFGKDVRECFTRGCCYWFAFILNERFKPYAEIYYNDLENHFACKIDKNLYDITGNCNNLYEGEWEIWDNFKNIDPLLAKRIERDCISKLKFI